MASNDVLHKFYWTRILAVYGVCMAPCAACAASPHGNVLSRHTIHYCDNILHACLCSVETYCQAVHCCKSILHASLCSVTLRKHAECIVVMYSDATDVCASLAGARELECLHGEWLVWTCHMTAMIYCLPCLLVNSRVCIGEQRGCTESVQTGNGWFGIWTCCDAPYVGFIRALVKSSVRMEIGLLSKI